MAKKNTFFTEHLPLTDSPISVYFLLELKKVDMRLKKKKNDILQRNIEENYSNIVQNQEQVAVISIAPVVKTSTSSCSSGKSPVSNKNSSSGSREETRNEIIELIAIWKEKEALYKTSLLFLLLSKK